MIDPRVKVIVSNVPVVDGYQNMWRVHGTDRFRKLQALCLEDRRKRLETGVGGTMPMSGTPSGPDAELVAWPLDEVKVVFEELKRTQAPRHEHWSTIESVELLMQYNAAPYATRLVQKPVMMIVANEDDITLWDLESATYESIPSRAQEARGPSGHQPHDALQQPDRARPRRTGRRFLVHRAPVRAAHRGVGGCQVQLRARPHTQAAYKPPPARATGSGGRWFVSAVLLVGVNLRHVVRAAVVDALVRVGDLLVVDPASRRQPDVEPALRDVRVDRVEVERRVQAATRPRRLGRRLLQDAAEVRSSRRPSLPWPRAPTR